MDGIVLIDKPKNFTSFDVVAVMRGVLHERKIGHTGTLDPMATGVLPLLVGKATKLCDIMPIKDKRYIATIKFGLTTDTLDITGEITSETDCDISRDIFEKVLPEFVGSILQKPPMYSAVCKNGVRLYDLARKGIEVERESRRVTVYFANILKQTDKNEFEIDVSCSSGTYIRSLCDDIGRKLGCGAVLSSLRRIEACGFPIDDCVTLNKAKEMSVKELIKPIWIAVKDFPCIHVTQPQAVRFSHGGQLSLDRLHIGKNLNGIVNVKSPDNSLIGLGKIDRESEFLNIKCLF